MSRWLTLLVVMTACAGGEAPASAQVERPKSASLELMDGPQLDDLIREKPGHPRIINFWATWCGPCKVEIPVLARFSRDEPDVEVILVNVDERAVQAGKAVSTLNRLGAAELRNVGLATPNVDLALARYVPNWRYSLPMSLVIDGDGRIAGQFTGAVGKRQLDAAIRETR